MRMRVSIRWLAVGSPARVRDTGHGIQILLLAISLQIRHFALGLIHVQLAVAANQCHTGTVIASVFQPVQALDQDVVDIPVSDISYYSTHKFNISCKAFRIITICGMMTTCSPS